VQSVFAVPLFPPREALNEGAWLAAARQGQSWALERFYGLYHGQIYALCHRVLGRRDDAEDAMQATFVRAFRELSRFRGDSALKTWLYRIAVNESLSILRKRRESPETLEETAGCSGEPAVLERLVVQAALARVKPAHRAILVLRFWEGLSYEEIAGVLGISLAAAKMRLLRARQEFRKCYEDGR
jgi:RNA polymerase sigma-70 factor, ECF subfamily